MFFGIWPPRPITICIQSCVIVGKENELNKYAYCQALVNASYVVLPRNHQSAALMLWVMILDWSFYDAYQVMLPQLKSYYSLQSSPSNYSASQPVLAKVLIQLIRSSSRFLIKLNSPRRVLLESLRVLLKSSSHVVIMIRMVFEIDAEYQWNMIEALRNVDRKFVFLGTTIEHWVGTDELAPFYQILNKQTSGGSQIRKGAAGSMPKSACSDNLNRW